MTAVDVAEETDEVPSRPWRPADRQTRADCDRSVPAILGAVRLAVRLHDTLGTRRVVLH